jgi:hypothetical protein
VVLFLAAAHLVSSILAGAQYFVAEWPRLFVTTCSNVRLHRQRVKDSARTQRDPLPRKGEQYILHIPPAPSLDSVKVDVGLIVALASKSLTPSYRILLLLFSFLGLFESPLYLLFHLLDFFRGHTASLLWKVAVKCAVPLARTFLFAFMILIAMGLYVYTYLPSAVRSLPHSTDGSLLHK